ncbi:MAG: thiamine phosphate synthase, partial [Pseudomonadota bacterium]
EVAKSLRRVTGKRNIKLLISADPQLAMQCEADGVHWPERDSHRARKWPSRFNLMTASAHSRRALANLQRTGIDAALVSTVFQSSSPSSGTPMGPIRFRQLVRANQTPVYGLGGVEAENMARIANFAGLAGVEGFDVG